MKFSLFVVLALSLATTAMAGEKKCAPSSLTNADCEGSIHAYHASTLKELARQEKQLDAQIKNSGGEVGMETRNQASALDALGAALKAIKMKQGLSAAQKKMLNDFCGVSLNIEAYSYL